MPATKPESRSSPGLLVEVGVNFVLPLVVYNYYEPSYGEVGALLAPRCRHSAGAF